MKKLWDNRADNGWIERSCPSEVPSEGAPFVPFRKLTLQPTRESVTVMEGH